MGLYNDLRKTFRYARGLRDYWRRPLNLGDPAATVRAAQARRENAFAEALRRSVYQYADSPYLWLLRNAGIEEPDVAALVAEHGLEGALRRLHDAGVYVTLDEFKGNAPIRRGSQTLETDAASFDNPASAGQLPGSTGASRSRGTRLVLALDELDAMQPARYLHFAAHDLLGRPWITWRPAPPALGGLYVNLLSVKLGLPLVRWFSQTQPGLGPTAGKSVALSSITFLVSHASGRPIPLPEYAPMDRADIVARWLAEQTAQGARLHVDLAPSSAMRVCLAARELGLDISGHIMRTSSEPLTEAKAALLTEAGLGYCSAYAILEGGTLGLSCGDPVAVDDQHLLTDRVAAIQDARSFEGLDEPVGALLLTVFGPPMHKVMLNVETGDHGVLLERGCDCPLGAAGLHTHLHTIRSYEKLTSAGMSFMGSALLDVLETALPARYGGGPTDYQFVESEIEGETVVKLVIAPGIGPLDEGQVIAYTLEELARRTRAGRMQTQIWRDSGTLRIERAQPYLTPAAKIQPLHVERRGR
jgi:hypothetical protein